jgi:ribosomal protein S12 methylthiotransferase accessory factor
LLRPKFKDKYHIELVPGDGVFLLAERDTFVLEGRDLAYIVPLIDGTRTFDDIVAAVNGWVAPADAYRALEVLLRAGHLAEADPATPPASAAFWSEWNVDTPVVSALLSNVAIRVGTVGAVDPSPLLAALQGFGLRSDPAGAVQVVLTDDYLRPELGELNDAALAMRMPMLLLKPVGIRRWIGPLQVPGKTACWRCLETRLRGNREVESYIERKTGKSGPFPVSRARIGLGELEACSIAAVQLVRWLATGANPAIESRILVADMASLSFDFHEVVRRPQCPACGMPAIASRAGDPIVLQTRMASPHAESGLRAEPPEATFARLQQHISPITGVVSAVTPGLWHGAGPIRTYLAGHNFALKSDQLWFLKDGLRSHSSGKGRTDMQARTSALCEALERYSGVFRGEERRVRDSCAALGDAAIDPRLCMLFSDRQYRERDEWLARQSRFQIVPLPFRSDDPIDWTPAWSLSHQRVRYLPSSYLYYNYPSPPEQFYCWADSNGAAAGATLEDAILQGLLELIERDAVSIWWYNRLRQPAVDLDGFEDGYISEMTAFYRQHDRSFWVLDVTSDLGIPVFVALSRRLSGPSQDIMLGFGAHIDPVVALNRALTELNQFIPALLNVAPNGETIYVMGDREAQHWWRRATVESEPYLLPSGVSTAFRDGPVSMGHDIGQLLHRLVGLLAASGYEVIVLDQTRPDIGLPVVKTVVPGLRHFWARFAPGRLYDVPVSCGLLSEPLAEADLNPTPMFL